MDSLRTQAYAVIDKHLGVAFRMVVSFPRALISMAAEMFTYPEKSTNEEQATIREALSMLEETGVVK